MAENPAQDAAADLLSEALQFVDDEETVEAPTDEEGEQQQDGIEIPEITWDTPDELREVLEGPDDEEEEVEEFENEGNVNYTPDDEYDDPEKTKLLKQLQKAQKQLAWERDQKTKQGRKLWADEARKYFQFSNPEVIQAKSRRAFLKEAERQHKAVAKIARPVFEQLAEERTKIKEQALAEARVEAEQRWGRPSTGPTTAQNIETTQSTARKRIESSRGLTSVIKEKLISGETKL